MVSIERYNDELEIGMIRFFLERNVLSMQVDCAITYADEKWTKEDLKQVIAYLQEMEKKIS